MRIIRSRHSSLIVRTNLSAKAFKFGDHAGRRTDFTPAASRIERNSFVNSLPAPPRSASSCSLVQFDRPKIRCTIGICDQFNPPNTLEIHAFCCNPIFGHFGLPKRCNELRGLAYSTLTALRASGIDSTEIAPFGHPQVGALKSHLINTNINRTCAARRRMCGTGVPLY
jgi:hypothetical protein